MPDDDKQSQPTAKVAAVSIKARTKPGKRVTEVEQAQIATLKAQGYDAVSIAHAVGRSPDAVYNALRSPIAQTVQATVLRDTVAAAKAVLADGAERAAVRLRELVESDRDDTALRAANSVLDRVGVGATSTVKHVRELSADELQAQYAEAVARLRAAGELE